MNTYIIYRELNSCSYGEYISFVVAATDSDEAMRLVIQHFVEEGFMGYLDDDDITDTYPAFLCNPSCIELLGNSVFDTSHIISDSNVGD